MKFKIRRNNQNCQTESPDLMQKTHTDSIVTNNNCDLTRDNEELSVKSQKAVAISPPKLEVKIFDATVPPLEEFFP